MSMAIFFNGKSNKLYLQLFTILFNFLRSVNCDLLTIGQYLRPSSKHVAIDRWYLPDEFESLKLLGESMGFAHVASGPLVRSSYHADEQHAAAFSSG